MVMTEHLQWELREGFRFMSGERMLRFTAKLDDRHVNKTVVFKPGETETVRWWNIGKQRFDSEEVMLEALKSYARDFEG